MKSRGWEFMEVDIGRGLGVPALNAKLGLAVVSGGGDIMDLYVFFGISKICY